MGKRNRTTNTPAAPAAAPTTTVVAPTTAVAAPVANATVANTTASNPQLAQLLTVGKAYNVRPNTAANNAATWQLLVSTLQANGGQATFAQLQAVAQAQRNHASFVGYVVRRGYLVPAQAAAPAPAAT
jgi:hypothetical protein